MDDFLERITGFLQGLREGETECNARYLDYLMQSIADFVSGESEYHANLVYDFFTGMYRISDDRGSPLADLVDVMGAYEKNSSRFTESHRDHYVHSVNVFLMGLYFYATNSHISQAFSRYSRRGDFRTNDERFLYVWGYTSLFHDIGYPIEIAVNQAKAFVRAVSGIGNKGSKTGISAMVNPLQDIVSLRMTAWKGDYGEEAQVSDLMADCFAHIMHKDAAEIRRIFADYPRYMYDNAFVDHAYYGAVIVLRAFSDVMQSAGVPSGRFRYDIVPAATAIFLHNFYSHNLVKRFGYPPLSVDEFPLAYLLILCDELQEWNRKGYGRANKNRIAPDSTGIFSDGSMLRLNYCVSGSMVDGKFGEEKTGFLESVLGLSDVFPGGLKITQSCGDIADVFLSNIDYHIHEAVPRPMLDDIVSVAKRVHEDYNRHRRAENPGKPLEYPDWETLPQDMKYSNMKQALHIPVKLEAMGYRIAPSDSPEPEVHLGKDEVMRMAVMEHDRWVDERTSNGWVWGPRKDVERRTSPYIAPWEDIPPEIQMYDVEAVENIPAILRASGFKIARM